MDSRTYSPLPGRGFGFFRRDRVWLAEDHLLSIRSSRFIDHYERYYFEDIQGIYFRDRRSEYYLFLAAAMFPCLCFLPLVIFLHWGWLIPLVPTVLWAALYAAYGRQADVHIQTILGLHWIPAVARRGHYDAFLDWLSPRIQEVQGALDLAELQFTPPPMPAAPPPSLSESLPSKEPYRSWFLEFTYAVVAFAALFSMWNHRASHGLTVDWIEYALSSVGLMLVIVGLVRSFRWDVGGGVMATLWGMVATQAVYGIGVGIIASFQNATRASMPRPRVVDDHPIRSLPILVPYATAMEGFLIALAVVGVLLLLNRKNQQTG